MSNHTAACIAVLMWAGAGNAQTTLAWKFTKGQTIHAERVASQKQLVEVNNKKLKSETHSVWHVRFEVMDVRASAAQIQATLTKVEHKTAGPAESELIDAKLHEKMRGAVFDLDVTPSGRVLALKGYGDFVNRLAEKDETRAAAVRVTLSESALTARFEEFFGPLPTKSVNQKERWDRRSVESMPHFGLLRQTASYEYAGAIDGRHLIDYTVAATYEPPIKDDRMTLFRVVKGSFGFDDSKGRLVFDADSGILSERDHTVRLRGELVVASKDRQHTMHVISENTLRIRIKR